MNKWAVGIIFGGLGVIVGVLTLRWTANRWSEFSDAWLFIPFFGPFLGFLIGFGRIANSNGQWPVKGALSRLLFCTTPAMLCGLGVYLSFQMVSFTWNQDLLPAEKAAFPYVVLHPNELPPLKIRVIQKGKPDVEKTLTWHPRVLIAFFSGMFVAFLGSIDRKSLEPL